VFLGILGLHALFAAAYERAVPGVHDEFSYLLAADTFLEGRLTNPTHPMWAHFETFHVFHHPTYASKYPPAQGFFLALGRLIGGHASVGVWLSMALAGAATVWMLLALVPARWALLGTGLFALAWHPFFFWGEGYWGGAVAMLGGALFFGGLYRTFERRSLATSLWMALGLFVLANSRPLESTVALAVALGLVLVGRDRTRAAERAGETLRLVVLPLVVAALVTLAWTAFYNARLTGDALEFPHENWTVITATQADIRSFHGSDEYSFLGKMRRLQRFFVGDVLLVLLLGLVAHLRSRRILLALSVVSVTALVSCLVSRGWPHYVAPVTLLCLYLLIEAMRSVARIRLGGFPVGAALVGVLAATHVGMALYRAGEKIAEGPPDDWPHAREEIIAELEEEPGEHLVLVRYGRMRNVHQEWIYNAADIDGSKIVWARDLGRTDNAALFDYFADRRVWVLRPGSGSLEVEPYDG
jgi:hypothetical protein